MSGAAAATSPGAAGSGSPVVSVSAGSTGPDPGPSSRTLVVVRHAKSSWKGDLDDHDRPLSHRGRRDAAALGGWLAEHLPAVDLVLCSSARRTRQTWARAAASGPVAAPVRYCDAIYQAGLPDLVALVRAVEDSVSTLLLLGHAPGAPDLVSHLALRRPDEQWTRLEDGFATAAVAVVDVTGPWSGLTRHSARLRRFEVPRG